MTYVFCRHSLGLRVTSAPPPRGSTVYCGFDPTAASLHVGHLLTISALLHFRQAGLQPIAVVRLPRLPWELSVFSFPQVGGATGRVGDPSGRVQEREVISEERVIANTASITQCLQTIFSNDHEMRGAGLEAWYVNII